MNLASEFSLGLVTLWGGGGNMAVTWMSLDRAKTFTTFAFSSSERFWWAQVNESVLSGVVGVHVFFV